MLYMFLKILDTENIFLFYILIRFEKWKYYSPENRSVIK